MVVMSTSTFIVSRPGSSGYPPTLPAEARSQSDQVLDREQNGDVADHPEDHLRKIAGDLQIVSARLQLTNAAPQSDDCAHRQQKEDRDDDQGSFKHLIRAHLRLDLGHGSGVPERARTTFWTTPSTQNSLPETRSRLLLYSD